MDQTFTTYEQAKNPVLDLKWDVQRRLKFIDFRLYWNGRVNRRDLQSQFGISVPQASLDIGRYQRLAPQNLTYDKNQKCYLPTQDYKPIFGVDNAEQCLASLKSIAEGTISRDDFWLEDIPDVRVVKTPTRKVDSQILQGVIRGIRDKLSLHVQYQSMSRPEPTWRTISPHALVFDSFRWHVRARCHNDGNYKDFVLARIYSISDTQAGFANPSADNNWQDSEILVMAPHPGLTKGQAKAVQIDYDMPEGVRAVAVSTALLYYVVQYMGLEDNPKSKRPQAQQIVLLNREEVLSKLNLPPQ